MRKPLRRIREAKKTGALEFNVISALNGLPPELACSIRSKSSTSTGAASSAATCPHWEASPRCNHSTSWVRADQRFGKFPQGGDY
jgi:hypothetical protein